MNKKSIINNGFVNSKFIKPRNSKDSFATFKAFKSRGELFNIIDENLIQKLDKPSLVSSLHGKIERLFFTIPDWVFFPKHDPYDPSSQYSSTDTILINKYIAVFKSILSSTPNDCLRSLFTHEVAVNELTQWCQSYDRDNIEIAAKILPTVDYTKKKHLMWQLAQEIGSYAYNFNRDKDVQYWMESSKLTDYYHMSAQDMILDLENKGILDPESFKYLEKIVRKEISIHNRDLYVFKVAVKPEYKKYLK